MAIAPQPPLTHDLPRRKSSVIRPPLTPPNVSVEAIKRSLMCTPSPRRFKKLRLRRLQESKKRDEDVRQMPLVDAGESLGEGYKGGGDSDGGSAVELQSKEHDELDELDFAVLNIGLDDDCVELECPPNPGQKSIITFETPHRDPQDSYPQVPEQDASNDQEPKNIGKKKKARNAKAKQKQPRRLPVDELILAPERVAELAQPEDEHETGELSQDPISQLSSDEGCSRYRRPICRRPVKPGTRKSFGGIDISEFRLPRSRNPLQPVSTRSIQAADYADGFEGDEGVPTGRIMPLSQRVRRPGRFISVHARTEELQLVSHKDFGEDDHTHGSTRQHPGQLRLAIPAASPEDNQIDQGNPMLEDPFSDEHRIEDSFEQDVESNDASMISEVQTAPTISSPLVRKQSQVLKAGLKVVNDEIEDEPLSIMVLPPKRTEDPVADASHSQQGVSRPRSLTPLSWRAANTEQTEEDLNTLRELAMVSVQKRIELSDSDESNDESSEAECSCGPYRRTKAGPKAAKRDSERRPDLDSGENNDTEMGYEAYQRVTNPNSAGRDPDEIDEDSDGDSSFIREILKANEAAEQAQSTSQEAREFWMHRKNKPSGVAMDVDDDIVCSPELDSATSRASSSDSHFARRLSTIASQAVAFRGLPTGAMRDDQGSIELGDTQKLRRSPEIPETQFESHDPDEGEETQHTVLLEDNYFTRAT